MIEATLAAAHARIGAVEPANYARTRNSLDGAVSGLSPYITHGFVTLTDVLAGVSRRHALDVQHKFVYELGWRAYFRHVWQHRGDAILRSLHQGPLAEDAYQTELPGDIRLAATGVAVIDEAVRAMYRTGTLHNHARMWLASYVIHIRKVHWRAGADWMYGHLLDGDIASNHLSWQWVAGTASSKPYLFNADNVARHAPAPWHSPGTVIDTSYEALDRLARDRTVPLQCGHDALVASSTMQPVLRSDPPASLDLIAPDAAKVVGRDVWLVHPWSLGKLPAGLGGDAVVIGVFLANFHDAWPWSEGRWQFVGSRMAELTAQRWYGDADAIGNALQAARRVRGIAEPHLAPWLAHWAVCETPASLFPLVERRCDSFSQWWTRAVRGLRTAEDLLSLKT